MVETVCVRRSPWDEQGRSADVPIEALQKLFIRKTIKIPTIWGDRMEVRAAHPYLQAYISCEYLEDFPYFPHSCAHGVGPHCIRVVICKCDNPKSLYAKLERMVK